MSTTPVEEKKKKQNWKFVQLKKRDIRLFKAIVCQKFMRRDHVIKYIFDGDASYAEIRIRKLKMFKYLRAVKKEEQPESYLLGSAGVAAINEWYAKGFEGEPMPEPQSFIEAVTYEHDGNVTETRFIFEGLGLCEDWKSEKEMRLGTQGERKVPDGFFTRFGKGIAVEVEWSKKDNRSYRRIFKLYEDDRKIDFVFYLCKNETILSTIIQLSKKAADSGEIHRVKFFCALFSELVADPRKVVFKSYEGEFKLEDLLIP